MEGEGSWLEDGIKGVLNLDQCLLVSLSTACNSSRPPIRFNRT